MKKLVIVGAGGLGREVLAWARQAVPPWPVKGFLDDNLQALARFPSCPPVLGNVDGYEIQLDDVFVCAIGQVAAKRRCVESLLARGAEFVQLVHRTATIGEGAELGRGVILCPGAILSSHARLGDFVTINLHSSVAHDSVVNNWSQLHCHVDVTGHVTIGESVLIGSHASVLPGVKVGDGATIGAASLVLRDVPAGTTVFGVPARTYVRKEASGG